MASRSTEGCFARTFGGPLDIVLGFRTPMTVNIRDARLGIAYYVLLTIFAYVVLYQVICLQGARLNGTVFGVSALSVTTPSLLYRRPPDQNYICDKANETTLNRSTTNPFSIDNVGVEFLPGGYYRVPGGVAAPQLSCLYASASMILPDPASSLGLYLPTYMEVVNETIEQGCEGYSTPACDSWITLEGSRHRYYIPDLRWYLININHGFTSSVGIAKSSQDISGQLLDRSGRAMDLCASYHKHALPCPPEVSTSLVSGSPTDFLPVQALLNAAGIESFDVRGGGDCGGLYDSTPRSSGLILTISIDYSNSFLSSGKSVGTSVYDDDYVKYSYRVRAVPKLPYATTQVISEDYFPANHRQVKKSTGIRIIFEQTGIIGKFSVFSLLISMVVSLGLCEKS